MTKEQIGKIETRLFMYRGAVFDRNRLRLEMERSIHEMEQVRSSLCPAGSTFSRSKTNRHTSPTENAALVLETYQNDIERLHRAIRDSEMIIAEIESMISSARLVRQEKILVQARYMEGLSRESTIARIENETGRCSPRTYDRIRISALEKIKKETPT